MEWIYPLGIIITFPIAYWQARKHLGGWLKDGDPLLDFLVEAMTLLLSIGGAILWPVTWVATVIVEATKKESPSEKPSEPLPEGYTYRVADKGGQFERVEITRPDGQVVADVYTSVYGLEGAAEEAKKRVLRYHRVENRSAEEYAAWEKKYGRKG